MNTLKNLKRYPTIKNNPLQAWDASDELVLSEVDTPKYLNLQKVLILNDSFGALSYGLQARDVTTYSDSFVSTKAIASNIEQRISLRSDLKRIAGNYELVILKLPKNLSFMEDILIELSNFLDKDTPIIFSGMIKHMSSGHFDLINKYIGETSTSLGKKKARLIYASFTKGPAVSPYPISLKIDEWSTPLVNESNLFSREKLDIGTRFFLENIPSGNFTKILDLGCANGIVGLNAKKKNPDAKIVFVDDSYMAIKSSKENYNNSFEDSADYFWTNCYEQSDLPQIDLVLCNPPFHQGTTIGDFIAWQMFNDAKKKLQRGGKMIVIGNGHLRYDLKLKKIFGNCTVINQNKKFMILESFRQ
ncbi:methyltransferase [Halobacteriovorax sp.]|uniref:methyltransferase n=1 Tax=Halobacteriovorax sp. TaxID=2020862 RepID=UPI003567936D